MQLIVFIFLLLSQSIYSQEKILKIEINLKAAPDNILFYLSEDNSFIDSALIKDEILIFNYTKRGLAPIGLVLVAHDKRQGSFFFIENSSTKYYGIYKDRSPFSAEGSVTQNELREYKLLTTALKDSANNLNNQLAESRFARKADTSDYKILAMHYDSLLKKANMHFIRQHPNSIISTQAIFLRLHTKDSLKRKAPIFSMP